MLNQEREHLKTPVTFPPALFTLSLIDADPAFVQRFVNALVSKYVEEISSGKFNLSQLEDRENKVCKYCNFRSICRIQEVN